MFPIFWGPDQTPKIVVGFALKCPNLPIQLSTVQRRFLVSSNITSYLLTPIILFISWYFTYRCTLHSSRLVFIRQGTSSGGTTLGISPGFLLNLESRNTLASDCFLVAPPLWTHICIPRSCRRARNVTWSSDTYVKCNISFYKWSVLRFHTFLKLTGWLASTFQPYGWCGFWSLNGSLNRPSVWFAMSTLGSDPTAPLGSPDDRRLVPRFSHTQELQGGPPCINPSGSKRRQSWMPRSIPLLAARLDGTRISVCWPYSS